MEIQVHGMTDNVEEEFALKLRAAGASSPVQFSVEESVWSVPSTSSGSVQPQVRLIPSLPKHLEVTEKQEIGRGDGDSWVMINEAEVSIDKEEMVRVVQVDRVELKGNAPEVLLQLGFTKKFEVGRIGSRVMLPNQWMVEYFQLFEPIGDMKNSNPRKRNMFVTERGKSGFLVTVKKQYTDERDSQAFVSDAWRVIKRLMPELQVATVSSIIGRA